MLIAWFGPADFPDPVGRPLVLAFGGALLAVGALLWRLADVLDLRPLATANAVTAAAAVAWLIAADGFSSAGSALTMATTAGLAALALLQLKPAGSGGAAVPAPGRRHGAG